MMSYLRAGLLKPPHGEEELLIWYGREGVLDWRPHGWAGVRGPGPVGCRCSAGGGKVAIWNRIRARWYRHMLLRDGCGADSSAS